MNEQFVCNGGLNLLINSVNYRELATLVTRDAQNITSDFLNLKGN
jgi:hypothetical protein